MTTRLLSIVCFMALSLPPVAQAQESAQEREPVVPVNRYTTIALGATQEQASLLDNVVDIHIPDSINSIGTALEYVLSPYGYTIQGDILDPQEQAILFTHPLPEPHRHLALMTVFDALTVLGGESFELVINPVMRTVSYDIRQSHRRYLTPEATESALQVWQQRHGQAAPDMAEIPAPSSTASPEVYGPVLAGETLGGIVETVGLNGLSLAQRMVQVFQHNPQAFINANMNALRQGAQLFVPIADEDSPDHAQATAFVRQQYRQWLEGRGER